MLHEAATTQRTLHTLHYARSPFYCTVRIGSRTVESARVSLLTECGPCSSARSPDAGATLTTRLPRSGSDWTSREDAASEMEWQGLFSGKFAEEPEFPGTAWAAQESGHIGIF